MIASILPALLLLAAPQTRRQRPSGRTPPSSPWAPSGRAPRSSRSRDARGGDRRRPRALAVLPAAERPLALPLGEEPVRAAGGLRAAGATTTPAWDTMPVPSNWQVVGANENRPYDRPFFSNIKHPFKADPPHVPHDDNPVGLYRKRFEVPAEWKGRSVFVHFAGVQSAYYVWLNGRKLGYKEDAFTPGEFDLTDAPAAGDERARGRGDPPLGRQLPRGPGLLAPRRDLPRRLPARAAQGAPARLRGAHRPRRRLPRRDPRAPRPRSRTARRRSVAGHQVVASVLAADGSEVFRATLAPTGAIAAGREAVARRPRASVRAPRLWSAETPNLYTLVLEHLDATGTRAGGRGAAGSASARSRSRAASCC